MSENTPDWVPQGFIQVGNYAFRPPFIPSEHELELSEEFIFSQKAFLHLEEAERRNNVIRLAVAASASFMLGEDEGAQQRNVIPLLGGIVQMTIERQAGNPVHQFEIIDLAQ